MIKSGTPLASVICELMADGQEWSLDRLTKAVAAQSWNFRGKSPRRAVHFTLLGLKNRGTAEMPGSQRWRLCGDASGVNTNGTLGASQ